MGREWKKCCLLLSAIIIVLGPSVHAAKYALDEVDETEGYHDVYADVRNLSASLSSVTGPGVDFINALKNMPNFTTALRKVAGPIGALIGTFVQIGLSEGSREYRAIEMLNDAMHASMEMELERSIVNAEYRQGARMLVETLKPIFFEVINPGSNASVYAWNEFREKCSGEYSPIAGLRFMRLFMEECFLPTAAKAARRAQIRDIFLQAEMSVLFQREGKSWAKGEIDRIKNAILGYYEKLGENLYAGKIANLRAKLNGPVAYQTLDDLLLQTLGTLKEDVEIGKELESNEPCLLPTVANEHKNNRTALFEHSKILQNDLIIMTLIGSVCTNVTAGTRERQKQKLKEIETIVNGVTAHLEQWLLLSMENSWPDETRVFLKEHIPGMGDIATDDYDKISIMLKEFADTMGPRNYHHRIIIANSNKLANGNASIFANCSKEHCFTIPNYRGAHIFVARSDFEEDKGRAGRANAWFEANRPNISAAIRDWGFNAKNLPILLNETNWALHDALKNASLYRTIILMRIETYFASDCQFVTGNATDPPGAGNSVYEILNPSYIHNANCFLFSFLL